MQLLKNPLFLLASFCYLVNRFLLTYLALPQYKVPYLNDLLCMPVMLPVALALQQLCFPQTARYRLNSVQVIFTVIYVTVLFEGILPLVSTRYTRDWWDVAAYAVGGLGYYYFLNPGKKPEAYTS